MPIPFKTYYAGLPNSPTPVPTDTILLMRGGLLYQMSMSQFLAGAPVKLFVDASIQNTIDLNGYSSAIVAKTDSSAILVTVMDSGGGVVSINPLSVQGECISLQLFNGVWYKS